MNKKLLKTVAIIAIALLSIIGKSAMAQVPANCGDVMLQAFDYYPKPINIGGTTLTWNDSKWTTLNNQATEIGTYFQMVWLPPSAKGQGHPTTMGYHPQFYFDQNSTFGTQAELITVIANLKTKNCKAIADIVVNHRSSPTNWCTFATETYKGVTYTPNSSWICNNDESKTDAPAGCNNPTGASDSGELYPAERDLDHTNSAVRDNIKAYMQFLKNDIGYSGWRYDVAKGYGQNYLAEYNDAAAGTFSVGEVMEQDYDYCKNWVINTGYKSTVFDFPAQRGLREALNNSGSPDYTKLVSYGQPRGLIAADMKKYAVTFVENHDTYRYNLGFYGNIEVANAFILSSPGVPCVYLPHWNKYKSNIQKMITARKKAGLHSESVVTNIQSATNIYVAKATGTNGELIVKLGSGSYSAPSDYTLEGSGTDWAIWVKSSNPAAPVISADKPSGVYVGGTTVTLSSTGGISPVKIYYTINGSAPSASSTLYTAPISITENNTRLRAIAIGNDGIVSSNSIDNTYLTEQPAGVTVKFKAPAAWTTVACYVWTTATPAVNLSGAWPGTVVTKGADGYYSYTITNATSYPVNVIFNNNANEQTVDLSASANICWDYGTSSVVSGKTIYTVTESASCGSTAPVVSISPAGGYYANGTNVTLSSTGGAAPVKIYYTLNGTTPTSASTLYTAPFFVTDAVVKAIAIDNGSVSSEVKTETYTSVPPSEIEVHFQVPAGWTTVKAWAWKGKTNYTGGVWPGELLTVNGGWVIFKQPIANSGFNIIFNNGDNNEQTVDITNVTSTVCYQTTTSTGTSPKKYNVEVITGCSTGIDTEKKASAAISVYPNPAKESVTIESDNNITEVKIYSIYGTLVKSVYLNSNSQTIELSGLPAGYYSVVVVIENGKQTNTKLIKR